MLRLKRIRNSGSRSLWLGGRTRFFCQMHSRFFFFCLCPCSFSGLGPQFSVLSSRSLVLSPRQCGSLWWNSHSFSLFSFILDLRIVDWQTRSCHRRRRRLNGLSLSLRPKDLNPPLPKNMENERSQNREQFPYLREFEIRTALGARNFLPWQRQAAKSPHIPKNHKK